MRKLPTINLSKKINKITLLLRKFLSDKESSMLLDICLRKSEIKRKKNISIVKFINLINQIEDTLSEHIGKDRARKAIKQSVLITKSDKRNLSRVYAEKITDLNIPPNELRNKIDFYQEREQLFSRHARELRKHVEELKTHIAIRRQIENELKIAKEQAELLYKITPSAIFTVDSNYIIRTWNDRAEELTGFSAKEVIGNDCRAFSKYLCQNEVCSLKDHKAFNKETAIICKDGTQRFILKNANCILDAEGNIAGTIESFIDITDRKRNQDELRKFQQAVTQSPSTVVITDKDNNIEYVNPKFTQLTGYTFEEVVGKNPRILKSGKQKTDFYKNLWDTITAGNEWRGELQNKKKNGEIYWEFASISPIRDTHGNIINYIAVKEDVTKRKEAHERIKIQNKFLNTIIESLTHPFYVIDVNDYTVKMANSAARLGGLSDVSTCYALTHKTDKPCLGNHICPLQEIKKNKKPIIVEHVHFDKEGNKRIVEVHGYPIFDSNGTVIQMIEYSLDITERKKAEEDLKKAHAELLKLNRLKDDFLATVSHELRTPLTIIREGVSQVRDDVLGTTTKEQKEFLSMSLSNIDRLSRMINDLLDISKIEAGKLTLHQEYFDIVELAQSIGTSFATAAKDKNIELKVTIPNTPIKIYADKDKITQVFVNLMSNSLKFTNEGYIELSIIERPDYLECTIADSGIGISQENLPKLFDKFQQFVIIDEPGEKGTGLGLSIAKGIVELHKGNISVTSALGEGTRFTFTIPKVSPETYTI